MQPSTSLDKSPDIISGMFNRIAPRYDLMNTLMTFGAHHRWRKKSLKGIAQCSQSLDICTGTGDYIPLLCNVSSSVTALDFSSEMLGVAEQRYATLPVNFIQGDALNLPCSDASFDLITIGFGVRNFSDLEIGLKEVFRVLKENGTLVILETGQATSLFWKIIETLHSSIWVPLISSVIANNNAAYRYCIQSTAAFPSGDAFIKILSKIGFVEISAQALSGGVTYIYKAKKVSS